MTTHADCGDRTCPCCRRRDADHGRALIAMGQSLVKRASGAKPTPKPEKEEADWIPPPNGLGIKQAEWAQALKGTKGTDDERTRQGLKNLGKQRSLG